MSPERYGTKQPTARQRPVVWHFRPPHQTNHPETMEGTINTEYARVCPRDLFNEAKLLKCLGQLALLVHDGKLPGLYIEAEGDPFTIAQHSAGYLLVVSGIKFWHSEECLQSLWLATPVNSRALWPLIVFDHEEYIEIEVFNEDGSLSDDFKSFLTTTSH